ncbi:MAG TPA: ABC transporter ATP-binding protein [Patescibacteria group bacterium]|nr:ABC transporter ATP-binding protein [Patescibacteria group bacterium]
MKALIARNLVKHYHQGESVVKALDGVSLGLDPGELVAIMGRSGSGKSTLLNMLGTLDHPDSGEVVIDNTEVSQVASRYLPGIRRKKIGFVFQQYNLIPTLTAFENVELPLKYAGIKKRRVLVEEALRSVGLENRATHKPSQLSGGEAQRVAIARAIVSRPTIILADEPTGEVDTQTATQIIELLKTLNKDKGVTIIIVTHDPLVAQETKRIIILSDGKIKSDQKFKRKPT